MKKIIMLNCSALCLFASCGNSNTASTAPTTSPVLSSNTIVGHWQHEASGTDENGNQIAEANEWLAKMSEDKRAAELKELGMSLDDLDLHFNADGSGYRGKEKSEAHECTWKDLGNKQYTITGIHDTEKDKYFITPEGKLQITQVGTATILGKEVVTTTFELWHKK